MFRISKRRGWGNNYRSVRIRMRRDAIKRGYCWRTQGFTPPVRDQGDSPYCKTAAAVAALEGSQYAQGHTFAPFLSEQHLMDGLHVPDKGSGNGRLWNYFKDFPRIATRRNYPARFNTDGEYERRTPVDSKKIKKRPRVKVLSWRRVLCRLDANNEVENHEVAIRRTLKRRPVLAFVHASKAFNTYSSGKILATPSDGVCNHAILLVAFRRRPVNHFIALNSWGPEWGEGGYVRLQRWIGLLGLESYYPVVTIQH